MVVVIVTAKDDDVKSDHGYSHSISHDDGHTKHVTHYYLVKCDKEKTKESSPLILESKKHTIILGHGDNKNMIVDKNGEKIIFR